MLKQSQNTKEAFWNNFPEKLFCYDVVLKKYFGSLVELFFNI